MSELKKSKFQIYYERSRVPEWRFIYIDYNLLKEMLNPYMDIVKLCQYGCITQSIVIQRTKKQVELDLPIDFQVRLKQLEFDFIALFNGEMEKSNQFYTLHLQQLEIQLKKLSFNLLVLMEKRYKKNQQEDEIIKVTKNYFILRESTKNLYKEVALLNKFSQMNRQATNKINNHYQKKAFFMKDCESTLKKIIQKQKKLEIYHESHQLNRIQEDIEALYISNFYRKNPKNGVRGLKAETKERVLTVKNAFLFGQFLGISCCLLFTIFIYRVEFITYFNPAYDLYFPMFRGLSLFILYFWLLAGNVYIWNMSHINYRQIFNFNHHYSNLYQILKRTSFFSMIFLVIFLLSLFKQIDMYQQEIIDDNIYRTPFMKVIFFPPALGPLIFWFVVVFYLIMPTPIKFNGQGRRYFWKVLWSCLISPLRPMNFTISWTTDQFVSFVGPLKDISYTICFYYNYFVQNEQMLLQCSNSKDITTGLIIAASPLILRMMQCGRLLLGHFYRTEYFYNFLKYTASLMVVIFSYFSKFYPLCFYFWVLMAAVSMIYSYYWDLTKDWKFFQPDTKYRFLRKQLAYDWPNFYYAIMILNILLRMTWTLSISPNFIQIWNPMFVFIISFLEIFRSIQIIISNQGFLWNFIRVEKEHVVNMGEFRVVPPIVFPYQTMVQDQGSNNLGIFKLSQASQEGSDNKQINYQSDRSSTISQNRPDSTEVKPVDIDVIEKREKQDIYKERIQFLKDKEAQLLQRHNSISSPSPSDEDFRLSYGNFQKKVEKIHVDYPEFVAKCRQEIEEMKLSLKTLTKQDVRIKDHFIFNVVNKKTKCTQGIDESEQDNIYVSL